jgi:hypothetical protein
MIKKHFLRKIFMKKMIVIALTVVSMNMYGMKTGDEHGVPVPKIPAAKPVATTSTWRQEFVNLGLVGIVGGAFGELAYRTGIAKNEKKAIKWGAIAAACVVGGKVISQNIRARRATKPVVPVKPAEEVIAKTGAAGAVS